MTAVLQKWTHTAQSGSKELVLPDGCRDLIRIGHKNKAIEWKVTPLQSEPELIAISGGTELTGFRLRPGAHLSADFLAALDDSPNVDEEEIEQSVVAETRAAEAIQSLTQSPNISDAAKACGVSVRSLRRVLVKETGKSPIFWLRLARARHAALECDMPLADTAAHYGYADQAHMAREFRRWFGLTPRALRADAAIQNQLAQPALATGEQISTKKPLISET